MTNKQYTPDEVAALEKQHGKLIHIRVFVDEAKKDVRECLVKDPTQAEDLSFLASVMEYDNPIKCGEYILDNLFVEGHDDFKINHVTGKCNNTKVRLAAITPCNQSVKFLQHEVVKH